MIFTLDVGDITGLFVKGTDQEIDINFNIEPKTERSAYLLLEELKKQKNLDQFCVGSFKSATLNIMRKGFNDKISEKAGIFCGLSGVAVKVSNEAVQILGGYGYTKDFPVERYYRDSKLCTIGEGTSEIQKLVISKQIIK